LKTIGLWVRAQLAAALIPGLPRRTADHKTCIGPVARSPVVFPRQHDAPMGSVAYRQSRAQRV